MYVSGTLWKHMDSGQHGFISLNFKLDLHTWQIPVLLYLQYRHEFVLFFHLNVLLQPYQGGKVTILKCRITHFLHYAARFMERFST